MVYINQWVIKIYLTLYLSPEFFDILSEYQEQLG